MNQIFFIAGGGALGALLRYGLTNLVHAYLDRSFPHGTLAVNIIGSFFMGLLFILLTSKFQLDDHWRLGLTTGLLGALTTFSTFSIETLMLLENGWYLKAIANITISVLFSLFACWLGLTIARNMI